MIRTTPARGAERAAPGILTLAVLTLLAVVAASCGGTEPAQDGRAPAPPASPPAEPPAAAGPTILPDVTVIDVVSGESLLVSSLAPADRPILLWFWAPH